jgi:hypothetical protein
MLKLFLYTESVNFDKVLIMEKTSILSIAFSFTFLQLKLLQKIIYKSWFVVYFLLCYQELENNIAIIVLTS